MSNFCALRSLGLECDELVVLYVCANLAKYEYKTLDSATLFLLGVTYYSVAKAASLTAMIS